MIYETIVTTLNADGSVQIAPMGLRKRNGLYLIAPFKPSTTLDNLQRSGQAVVNLTDDVRIFAGCLTGRYDWPLKLAGHVDGQYLDAALTHLELEVEHQEDDGLRPRFYCRLIHEGMHAPFRGFNRAQVAVLECAILVSRLDRLPREKITGELEYLQIAIDKTAGERELQAWQWLMERVDEYLQQTAAESKPARA